MTRFLKGARMVVVGGMLAAIALEVTALLAYAATVGGLFYARDRTDKGAVPAAFHVAEAVFQPYAGYVLRPGRSGSYDEEHAWRANNSGFQYIVPPDEAYCCDVPHARDGGEKLVGVFGGSVGTGFAFEAQTTNGLKEAVRRIFPDWADAPIRVLNFALPGYRQPQQAMALSHFLTIGQNFDLVINIDGFNETVTGFGNWRADAPVSYPADQLWGAWGRQLEQYDVPVGEAGYLLANYHGIMGRQADERAGACPIASCYYGFKVKAAYHAWRRAANEPEALERLTKRSYFPTKGVLPRPDETELYEHTGEIWQRASLAMHAMARAHGIPYIHILQPNQWYAPAGAYEPIDPEHPYDWVVEPVNRGYDAFRARMPALEAAGVRVQDFSTLFKGQDPRALYSDDCCHYTSEGNARIFNALGEAMAAD